MIKEEQSQNIMSDVSELPENILNIDDELKDLESSSSVNVGGDNGGRKRKKNQWNVFTSDYRK
jgi:hypothetical protein